MELEHCINFVLTKAQHAVHQLFKSDLAPYGVTPGQYGVLRCLWDEDCQTARQLAERLALDGSTMTGVLDRMEQRGLIVKQTDPRDRRALQIQLTQKGRDLKVPLEEVIEKANQKVLEGLEPERIEALKQLLWNISKTN
ncbi:MAG: MarR family winged helix-turn-helix transcriptional regulator [Bacillota bacterium]|jgi:DNA-binding MarR family transcriptional regulator